MNLTQAFTLHNVFSVSDSLGGKCKLDTDTDNEDGTAYGNIEFSVPRATTKWRLEIEFDSHSNVTSIDAYLGSNERCYPNQNKCIFENDDYGMDVVTETGDEFDASSFEIVFDDVDIVPEIKQVIFRSCHEACDSWTTNAIVCGEEKKSDDEISES